jgi:nucleoside-diphosphate-sugar epimerase
MHVLVTGAGGFSGSHIALQLIADGHDVTVCVGHSPGRFPLDAATRDVLVGDLAGELPLPKNVDAVVHAAARLPGAEVTDEAILHSNIEGTRRIVNYARSSGAKTLIYLSSLSVYGNITAPIVDEATPIEKPDTYGKSKWFGEQMLRCEQFRSLAIRLPGIIGPRPVLNWLTNVLHQVRAGSDISVFNPDAAFNNAVHVSDLAALVSSLLVKGWKGFDIVTLGAAGQTTVRQAVQTLIDAFGATSRIVVRTGTKPSFVISSSHACDRYGYRPMEISSMLRRFAAENQDSSPS